jgi:DNA mismatch repair protein MutH
MKDLFGGNSDSDAQEEEETTIVTTYKGQPIKTGFVCVAGRPEVHAIGKVSSVIRGTMSKNNITN